MARQTATATKALAQHDKVRDPKIEKILDDYGVRYELIRDVSTTRINHEESLANQARFSPLNLNVVAQYRRDLRDGDIFPAVVVHNDVIVDGNHRLRAHSEEGLALAAYVIDADTEPDVVVKLTFKLNKPHGLNLTIDEKLAHAAHFVEAGMSHADACQEMGIDKVSRLTNYMLVIKANRLRVRANVPDKVWNRIKADGTKLRIGAVTTHVGLKLMAELVVDAGLNTTETSKYVREVNQHRGTEEQRAYILDLRDVLLPNGKLPTQQNTGRGMGMRQQFGGLYAIAAKIGDDIEGVAKLYKGGERAKQAEKAREAATNLNKLAERLSEPDSNTDASDKDASAT
jgi:ParB-like chromosome segregation protein Spo0J